MELLNNLRHPLQHTIVSVFVVATIASSANFPVFMSPPGESAKSDPGGEPERFVRLMFFHAIELWTLRFISGYRYQVECITDAYSQIEQLLALQVHHQQMFF